MFSDLAGREKSYDVAEYDRAIMIIVSNFWQTRKDTFCLSVFPEWEVRSRSQHSLFEQYSGHSLRLENQLGRRNGLQAFYVVHPASQEVRSGSVPNTKQDSGHLSACENRRPF